jgi:retron-type reverse transcriptase
MQKLNTSKKKALKKIFITLFLIVFTLSIAPYSNKTFQELSSFNQYQPCKKQFNISKWEVKHAYELVKANKGSAGVDNQSIEGFERDLKGNLYKIWNRLSSGTYFPPRAGSRIFSANYIIIINFLNFFEFR